MKAYNHVWELWSVFHDHRQRTTQRNFFQKSNKWQIEKYNPESACVCVCACARARTHTHTHTPPSLCFQNLSVEVNISSDWHITSYPSPVWSFLRDSRFWDEPSSLCTIFSGPPPATNSFLIKGLALLYTVVFIHMHPILTPALLVSLVYYIRFLLCSGFFFLCSCTEFFIHPMKVCYYNFLSVLPSPLYLWAASYYHTAFHFWLHITFPSFLRGKDLLTDMEVNPFTISNLFLLLLLYFRSNPLPS